MLELKEYRGHIRNHRQLCEELSIESGLTREEREKAILTEGYKKWGKDIASHIYGMFAFAIYDTDKDELFCIRDQFGTKPFYYYLTENSELLYGTMIRDIISKDGFKKELNRDLLQI